jgi:predicted MFS family arabinose efflux permease
MRRADGGWPLVFALAAAQLVSWGSIYYSFSLFVVPMEHELNWSRNALNGALSAGLVLSGLASYPVGAWIDRAGGRIVMSLGSAIGAALLFAWSRTAELGAFYAIWMGLGLALAATLYEPGFAVLTRLHPDSYRARITAMTLVGGFASTVFIPLTALAIERLGWRDALVALALCNALFCLPLHGLWLRDRTTAGHAPRRSGTTFDENFRRALRHKAFWGLGLSFTAYGAVASALTFHIVPLLEERHVPTATMLTAIALFGPAQVAGRIVLLVLGPRASAVLVGRIGFTLLPVAIVLLLFPSSVAALFVFYLLFGASNGVITVVRGTAVPELLWRESYGAINGALTLPTNLARAVAPWGAALLWSAAGSYDAVLWACLALSAVSGAGFWYASYKGERR